ncbi:MAG: AAA family ATPase [Acidimicrobiales bacterium]
MLLALRPDRLLEQAPAVLVVGPRAAGKTTTASRQARSVVRLDREAEAAVFRADPDAALRQFEEPILLDEWQNVPAVLGAVKRAVDSEPRPGRFVLTGSVSAEHDPASWPGVGRLIRVRQYGLTQRELQGDLASRSLLARLWDGERPATQTLARAPDLPEYMATALRGTFPEPALQLDEAGAERWFLTYAEQIVGRDVALLGTGSGAKAQPKPVTRNRGHSLVTRSYVVRIPGSADRRVVATRSGCPGSGGHPGHVPSSSRASCMSDTAVAARNR